MESYTGFAEVYDEFMEDTTPYELWRDKIIERINLYGVTRKADEKDLKGLSEYESNIVSEKNIILELGCGTGTMTTLLAMEGYDVMGIDLSYEMLERAREKAIENDQEIMYFCQNMKEFELYSTVGTIISICDSINYILEDKDLIETFKRVNNYLFPGGIFVFDFNTLYKYKEVIGNSTIAENHEDASFIWENYFNDSTNINEYDLTIFSKIVDDEGEEFFERIKENHYQRGYKVEEILAFLKEADLELLEIKDADTNLELVDTTQRVFIVAKTKKEMKDMIISDIG